MRLSFYSFVFVVFISCSNSPVNSSQPDAIPVNDKKAIQYTDSVIVYKYQGSAPAIDEKYLATIPESTKALLAYYCYQFNTGCKSAIECDLTRALGFEQNSPEHKLLVKKWFDDEETLLSIENGGNVKPNGENTYAWLSSLCIFKKNEFIQIKYESAWISNDIHGKGEGCDEYKIVGSKINVVNRNHTELDIQ